MPSSNNELYFHIPPQAPQPPGKALDTASNSVSVYRVCLVKDQSLSFGNSKIGNADQATP